MKKVKLNTAKLQLRKSTITALTNEEMHRVQGGVTAPSGANTCGCGSFNQTISACASMACPAPAPPSPSSDNVCSSDGVVCHIDD